MSYTPDVIPLPTYLLDDKELCELHRRLAPYAVGDPKVADEPCERAATACAAIVKELDKRGTTVDLANFTFA